MLDFPEGYFQKEVRDGFEVASMMKRAWAGQLEVLQVVREICERHGIRWFADYGTLLGAVRHKGYIPWDDDLDIGMTRDQLNLFIRYARDELPSGFRLLCTELEPEYDSLIVRVVNASSVSVDDDRLRRFHGCPYALGLDIFPLDYLPRDAEERDVLLQLVNILIGAADAVSSPEADPAEVEAYLTQVEGLLGIPLDRTRPIRNSIYSTVEKLAGCYGPEDADEVTGIWRIIWQKEFHFPKEWFAQLEELPFENVSVFAPSHYHEVLSLKMGADYMTPKQQITHDYPFYKQQEEILAASLGFIPE
jgi:lipopolysaccharide cholinephosphotransferase